MKKIKKILTGTLLSAISITAIGCSSTQNKITRKIDKSMTDFVSCINRLDYVDTTKPASEKIGKIVETNTTVLPFSFSNKKLDGDNLISSKQNSINYLNEKYLKMRLKILLQSLVKDVMIFHSLFYQINHLSLLLVRTTSKILKLILIFQHQN